MDALKDRAKNARDVAATAISKHKSSSTNQGYIVLKSVAQAWCDMTSPSFWANTIVHLANGKTWSQAVTLTPEVMMTQSLAKLRTVRTRVLADLDAKTKEVQAELDALQISRQ